MRIILHEQKPEICEFLVLHLKVPRRQGEQLTPVRSDAKGY